MRASWLRVQVGRVFSEVISPLAVARGSLKEKMGTEAARQGGSQEGPYSSRADVMP